MNDLRAKYNERWGAGGLADNRFDCLQLRCVGNNQRIIEPHCGFAGRRDDVMSEGKQNTLFSENCVHGLMLSSDRHSVQFEPYVEAPTRRESFKTAMEPKFNLCLPNKMYMPFKPLAVCRPLLLDKDSIP